VCSVQSAVDIPCTTNSVVSAASIFGRTIPPYFADHLGSFNVVTLSACGSGVCILALWLPFNYHSSHAGLIVFALAYGFFSGAFVSLLMPCVARSGSIETLGRRFGTFQIVLSIRYFIVTSLITWSLKLTLHSCLTGLPIMGAILNRQGDHDYSGLQVFGGSSCLLGSVLLLGATLLLGKTQGTRKV
jgi:MFS family permease